LVSIGCYSQQTYQQLLLTRVADIKHLAYYDNSVVVYDESSAYGSNYAVWNAVADYYADDIVLDKNKKVFRALVDSKGKEPSISPKEWEFVPFSHPYFFLRDTARVEDLKQLLVNDHPYVKTYAFGALANKKVGDLYNVILDNLSDTTQIDQMTADFGYDVCPADLMICYFSETLSVDQKKHLQELLETKFQHLKDAWGCLHQK
jgi:hypothetical protein